MQTFEQYQESRSSEKVGLATFEVTRRLLGWTLYSGSIYQASLTEQVVVSLTQDGTALTSVASVAAISSAGKYYFDRANGLIYLRTSDSSDPLTKFITLKFKLFFSNIAVSAPHDLSTGYEVHWEPMLDGESQFTYEIDGARNLLGVAISNTSDIKLRYEPSFWDPIYDKVYFEQGSVSIFSWERSLPITEAAILYKGKVSKRSLAGDSVQFELRDFLDELRAPVSMSTIGDYGGARVPTNMEGAFQRRLYGYVRGHIPTNIDQVLPTTGYPLTGTMTATPGSASITGSGTLFLEELSPGDDLLIGTAGTRVRVDAITSNTALTLSEAFSQSSQSAVAATVRPSHNKRYANRAHLVAGHELSRPSVVITEVIDNASFRVSSTADLVEGDAVEYGGAGGVIRLLGDDIVKLVEAFTGASLAVGGTVYRSSVGNVYLNGQLLTLTRDYTYSASTAVLTLTDTAEFNVAPTRKLTGTISVTSGDRTVEGTGTQFNTELSVGDWINVASGSNWYEILEIVDETNLIIRTSPGSTESGAALLKKPDVFGNGSVIVCDAIGKKSSGGTFLRYPGQIASDLLSNAGLDSVVDATSFDDVDDLLPHRIGFAIPEKVNDKKSPPLRDILNGICRSTFSSIIINNDFELQMVSLDPSYSGDPIEFKESDILDWSVLSDSSQLVSVANITYDSKEHDAANRSSLDLVKSVSNDQYLSQTEKEFSISTYLIDEDDAEIIASRWAFMLSATNSDIRFKTKMQGARLQVFDVVKISHEKFYERIGSSERTRLGVVMSVRKTIGGCTVVVNDLGNSYSRAARIAENGSDDFDDASEADLLLNGYQTDANGLTNGIDALNLIW